MVDALMLPHLVKRPARLRTWEIVRPSGKVDWRRTFQLWRRYAGQGLSVRYHPRRMRPPRLFVFWDVSGSMGEFVPLYLEWLRRVRLTLPQTRVFPFGTSITEISAALDLPAHRLGPMLKRMGEVWGAGTTIGGSIVHWLEESGRAALRPGSWVWILSDGWDRGEPEQLVEALGEFRRSDIKIWWLHPYAGTRGFEPKTRALQAALPWIERVVPAGSLTELYRVPRYLY